MSTTSHLTDKLDTANEIKAAIYSAILAKGGTFASGTDFSDYPAAILSIPEGGEYDFSWIRRAQDGELTDLRWYKLPGGLAGINGGMQNMFNGCSNITTAPDLSGVTSVAGRGMYGMFGFCTSLTTGPDLSNVTTVGDYGMGSMFEDCRNLISVDLSNITSVGRYGIAHLLGGCRNITSVDLSNITSVGWLGMHQMLYGCQRLTEIKVGWSTWPIAEDSNPLTGWVYGVSATGTFHCPPGLPEIFDVDHIPVGWTVVHDVV